MKICYKYKNFHSKSLIIIDNANKIIKEYEKQGYQLTLRQLYYQFVARDLIPNSQSSYHNLGNIINDARLAGLISWTAIIDRTRNLQALNHWNSPDEIIKSASNSFRYDKWDNQPNYVEVWIEKDALIGVIARTCESLDVPYFSCRGYTSSSEVWSAAQRINSKDKPSIIIHLGDHDPSGIDMTRDIETRMDLFDCPIEVDRIALNMDQVEEYKPPPNPAKNTDTRFKSYIMEYGKSCWELDALEPKVMDDLIKKNIIALMDIDQWEKDLILEQEERMNIKSLADNYNEAIEHIKEN